jgi:pyridoxine/pyridoxamine 5'-phosphate oxidase
MSRPDQSSAPARPAAEPLGLLPRWLGEAAAGPGGDPPAVVLATVNEDELRTRARDLAEQATGRISPYRPWAAAGTSPPPR